MLKKVIARSFWITIGALTEVITESIVALAMIKTNNENMTFQATTAFGLCLVFTHLFQQPFVSGINHFLNYKMKMFIGMGDHSDTHLCLWWKRNKSLKFAFFGAIIPSTLLFFTVGFILRSILYGQQNKSEREDLINMTVACSRLLLPGFAFKILAQKERTFACAVNTHFVMLFIQVVFGYVTFSLLCYLFTENINLGYGEGSWYDNFDAGVLTGIALAYDISYYLQFMFCYAWNTWKYMSLDVVTTADLQAAEIMLPSNP